MGGETLRRSKLLDLLEQFRFGAVGVGLHVVDDGADRLVHHPLTERDTAASTARPTAAMMSSSSSFWCRTCAASFAWLMVS